jgi:hypothetical protein
MMNDCDHISEQLIMFLKDHLKKLKYLFIHNCHNSNLLDFILKEADNLEYANIENHVFERIRDEHQFGATENLVIHNFQTNEAHKIKRAFPNLKSLHIYYPRCKKKDDKSLIFDMLPNVEVYLDSDLDD